MATYVRVHTLPDGHVDFNTADRFLLDTDSKALHMLSGVHPVAVFAPRQWSYAETNRTPDGAPGT
jgi:hypothetical protein